MNKLLSDLPNSIFSDAKFACYLFKAAFLSHMAANPKIFITKDAMLTGVKRHQRPHGVT